MPLDTMEYDREQLAKVEQDINQILNSGPYVECQITLYREKSVFSQVSFSLERTERMIQKLAVLLLDLLIDIPIQSGFRYKL